MAKTSFDWIEFDNNTADPSIELDSSKCGLAFVNGTLKYLDDGSWSEFTSGSGAATFLGLTDTPSSFTGAANKFLKVNADGDAVEFGVVTGVNDTADVTKDLVFNLGGATTGKTMTIVSSQDDDYSLTLPNATDTLVGKATTDILTNKTINADGTGNVISNINVDELDSVGDAAYGIPFVISKTVTNLATTGTNIIDENPKMKVIDAWFVAASDHDGSICVHAGQVGSIGTAITNVMTISAADKGITRATTIDDASWVVAEDGGLVAVGDAGAAVDGTIFVLCMRVD